MWWLMKMIDEEEDDEDDDDDDGDVVFDVLVFVMMYGEKVDSWCEYDDALMLLWWHIFTVKGMQTD